MPANIIDGKKLSNKILIDLREKIKDLPTAPSLAAIMIGDDPASKLYVANKKKACLKVGIDFNDYFISGVDHPTDKEEDILKTIDFLNNDESVDGIIIQIPIPDQFDTQTIINRLDPKKDVDGFHPKNKEELLEGKSLITPPLIMAVTHALESTDQNLIGKQGVIVSKNPIFSEPLAEELQKIGLKITTTKPDNNFTTLTKTADVLISVVGQPGLITKDMVKPGATIIDIGTTMVGDKQWAGDVDPAVAEVAGFMTPVPGGIGPLTVAMLLQGTYDLARARK